MTSAAPREAGSSVARLLTGIGAIAVIGPVIVLLVQQFGSLGNRSIPCCDYAALELGTRAFLRGDQWVGLYSREGWRHPGPAPFLWDSLFRILPGGGFAEHQVAAVSLGLIALVVLLVVLRLRLGLVAYLAGCLILVVWLFQFDPSYLREPWNPIVAMSWMLLAGTAFAAFASGGSFGWIVLFIAAGSMGVQTHVGAGPVFVLAAVVLAVLAWRRRSEPELRRTLVAGAGVAAVLWALPLYDLVFGEHNLWYMVFGPGGDVPLTDFGLGGLVGGIVHIVSLGPSSQALHFGPASPFLASEPVTLAQIALALVGLVLGCLAVLRWRERPFAAACAGFGLAGLLATGFVLAVGSSAFLPYLLFPVIAFGPLIWIGGVANVLAAADASIGGRAATWWPTIAGATLLVPALLLSYFSAAGLPTDSLVSRYSDADTQQLMEQIQQDCDLLPARPIVAVQDTIEWLNAISIAEAIDSCDRTAPPKFIGFTGFVAGPSYEAEADAIANVFVVTAGEVLPGAREIARAGDTMILVFERR